jgi:hypothetical protein
MYRKPKVICPIPVTTFSEDPRERMENKQKVFSRDFFKKVYTSVSIP